MDVAEHRRSTLEFRGAACGLHAQAAARLKVRGGSVGASHRRVFGFAVSYLGRGDADDQSEGE